LPRIGASTSTCFRMTSPARSPPCNVTSSCPRRRSGGSTLSSNACDRAWRRRRSSR
jgi:hypothetical protein